MRNSTIKSLDNRNKRDPVAPIPLVRIENIAPEAVVLAEQITVAGRLFLPAPLQTSDISLEASLEYEFRSDGSFVAGMFYVAQRLASMPQQETGTSSCRPRVVATRLSAIEEDTSEDSRSGSWFRYEVDLELPHELTSQESLVLKVLLLCDDSISASNGVRLIRLLAQNVEEVWFSSQRRASHTQIRGIAHCVGSIIFESERIESISVEGLTPAQYEVSWQSGGEREKRRFLGRCPTHTTAISVLFSPSALPPALGVPVYLCVTTVEGLNFRVHIPRPLYASQHPQESSCIEAISIDEMQQIKIEGWFQVPLEWERCEFVLETRTEKMVFGEGRLAQAKCQRRYRPDIADQFPGLTESTPWGFELSFSPYGFSAKDGEPRLLCGSGRGAETCVLGSFADRAKLYSILKQFQTSSRIKQTAARILGRCIEESQPTRVVPGARRERLSGASPSRILFCSHNFSSTEGAPRVLFNLVSYLQKRDNKSDVEMLVLGGGIGGLQRELETLGVRAALFPQLHSEAFSEETFSQEFERAASLVREFKPDCVYANTTAAYWGVELAQRFGVPCLWAIHESKLASQWGLTIDPRYAAKVWSHYRSVAHALFVASATQRLLERWMPNASLSVVPNGVDVDSIARVKAAWNLPQAREVLGIPASSTVVSIIGTTTERKGQDIFLRMARELRDAEPERDFVFLVLGARESEYLDMLRALARELGINDHIRFVPETPEVAPYFIASDVMVLCSREESAPLVSLEAFAYGCPLVSTAVFGLAEQLCDGVNALTFPVDDFRHAASQVRALLGNPELRQRLVDGATQSLARFTLQSSLEAHWQCLSRAFREFAQ